MPLPTDEKPFGQTHRVLALFKAIEAGRHATQVPSTAFRLAREYEEIERQLGRDEEMAGFVEAKIRQVYSDARGSG